MKTIEEKAKAYDEALERAKAYHRSELAGSRKEMMEYIFPQLRESDDERIRKALIDALKVSETIGELKFRLPYPTKEECIAYLEKQKEQKPWKVGANAYFTPEQKPAEWSEEDKTHLSWIIECFDSWKHQVPEFADQYQSAIDFLKSLRPSWKPND